jgi:hypothetical protein
MTSRFVLFLIAASVCAGCRRPAADPGPALADGMVREVALRRILEQNSRDIGLADADVYCLGANDAASEALRARVGDVADAIAPEDECGPSEREQPVRGTIVHEPTGRRAVLIRFGEITTPAAGLYQLEVSYTAGAMHGQGFACTVERAGEGARVRECRNLWIS